MLLGDLMARLENEDVAAATLESMGDLALTAAVVAAASREGISSGAFIADCVAAFANGASDEEWTTVIGQMGRASDPGQVLLRRAVRAALPAPAAAG